MKHTIRVPASSANLGPGFDSLGIALQLYLTLTITIPHPQNKFELSASGIDSNLVSTDPSSNLITTTASLIAKKYNKSLPDSILIQCDNEIPFGGGLGSSGSAIVAGACLANIACDLGLSIQDILQECIIIEGHPDNAAPSVLGLPG
jgi:homoserine kinase